MFNVKTVLGKKCLSYLARQLTTHSVFRFAFINWPPWASFSFIFISSNKYYKYLQQNVKKCPSSKRCYDLNPQSSEHESPPFTTRPVANLINNLCS